MFKNRFEKVKNEMFITDFMAIIMLLTLLVLSGCECETYESCDNDFDDCIDICDNNYYSNSNLGEYSNCLDYCLDEYEDCLDRICE